MTEEEIKELEEKIELAGFMAHDPIVSEGLLAALKLIEYYKNKLN